jgi:hypothetical protein
MDTSSGPPSRVARFPRLPLVANVRDERSLFRSIVAPVRDRGFKVSPRPRKAQKPHEV